MQGAAGGVPPLNPLAPPPPSLPRAPPQLEREKRQQAQLAEIRGAIARYRGPLLEAAIDLEQALWHLVRQRGACRPPAAGCAGAGGLWESAAWQVRGPAPHRMRLPCSAAWPPPPAVPPYARRPAGDQPRRPAAAAGEHQRRRLQPDALLPLHAGAGKRAQLLVLRRCRLCCWCPPAARRACVAGLGRPRARCPPALPTPSIPPPCTPKCSSWVTSR